MPRQILKRRADGRYRCKYKERYFYGETQAEALQAREEYKRQEAIVMRVDAAGITVKSYAAKWVTTYKSHLTDGPYNTHVRILNKFCEYNNFGSYRIKDINTSDIQDFYNLHRGKSRSSICDLRDTIRGLFRSAIADRLIDYDPTMRATLPKASKGTHRVITGEEKQLITATPHRMRAAALVMLYAGLRRGEVLALQSSDIEGNILHIRRAVRFSTDGKPILVDPKTYAGIRDIMILPELQKELENIQGPIVTGADGQMMTESGWKRGWDSYMVHLARTLNGRPRKTGKNAKMDTEYRSVSIRAHDLRHTYATMLYSAGVDEKTIMKWMGHSSYSISRDVYIHHTDEQEKASFEALKKATRGQNGGLNTAGATETIDN